MPTLYIMFEGVQVQIIPDYYVYNTSNVLFPNRCEVQLAAGADNQILLGDTLFLNYIVTFSKQEGQVGFYGNASSVYTVGDHEFVIG